MINNLGTTLFGQRNHKDNSNESSEWKSKFEDGEGNDDWTMVDDMSRKPIE